MASATGAFPLILALGNPGSKYDRTRHNAGFWWADRVVARFGGDFREEKRFQGHVARVSIDGYDTRVVKPATFMNHSGRCGQAIARYFGIEPERILVVHDEIDLPPGQARLKQGGGHGGHNGLRDLVSQLGTREFSRLRIGVGHPGSKDQVVPYVLGRPTADEEQAILRAVDDSVDELPTLLAGEWERACTRLHTD